jgi:hypothetical protein
MSEAITPAPADARTERHLRMLQELAEIGMDLARGVRAQALDPAAEAAGGDFGLVFSRIARAVRQTLALETRIAQEQAARDEQRLAEETRRNRDAVLRRGRARKNTVHEAVEQAVMAEAEGDELENLLSELDECLEDEDELDFADRPIGEQVARICRGLDIEPDWSLWKDEDWAIDEAAANAAEAPRSEYHPARGPLEDEGGGAARSGYPMLSG